MLRHRYITCPSIPLGSDKNTYKKHSCDSLFLLYEQHNISGFKVRVGAILLLPLPLHQLPPQPARLLHVVPIGGRPPSKLVSPVLCVTSTSTCRVLSSLDLDSIFVTILCQISLYLFHFGQGTVTGKRNSSERKLARLAKSGSPTQGSKSQVSWGTWLRLMLLTVKLRYCKCSK